MKQINWGIIGTGSIASAFAHSIEHCSHSKLSGVYGRNAEALNVFSKKFKVEPFKDIESFLDTSDIDAVYVATPHNTHFKYSLEAIKNNKHVLCEKPLTMNHLESMILLNLAKDKELFLMEAFMYRTHPQTQNILQNLSVFEKGLDIKIESSFGFAADVPESHRLRNPELGGGSILDVGCYPLSMVRLIAGAFEGAPFADPISIDASGEIDSTGTDLSAKAELKFSNNINASINTAINQELQNNLVISAGDTKLIVDQPWHCGQFQEGRSSIKIYKNEDLIKEVTYEDKVGLFTREIDHASSMIINNMLESEYVSHQDSQGNMLWLDKWRQQLDINCPLGKIDHSPIPKVNFYKLQKRTLDSINEDISTKTLSRLALGCDNQTSRLHAYVMFDHFYGRGGRIFDTAYIYNNGMGDTYLGDWINSRGLEDEVIVLGKGAHTPQCEPKYIKPQIEESLERLKLKRIDIFCLHRDNHEIPVSEFVDALDEIKKEGLIDKIGASNWKQYRFEEARSFAITHNKEPFTALSNNFSLAEMIEPVWPGCVGVNRDYLNYLKQNDILLFPWSSQARGFFIQKKTIKSNDHFSNPSLDEEKRVWHSEANLNRRQICFDIAAKRNVHPIEVALAYVIQTSSLIYPLIGPRTVFETDSSISAVSMNLTDSEMEKLSRG